ncbi:MAG: phenylalanine--tRNA ligase subunit beta [Blastocatellia bacterium]
MKISYNWLKEFVEIDPAPRDLATKLTMAGLAVDAVEAHGGDFVLELDLTSNRPDCLSHLGIAREVAVLTGQKLHLPEAKFTEASVRADEVTSVEIHNPELCPRYTARVIRGVSIGPSPQWLVDRLERLGQRSVNNVADITNLVMLELGQPLHAFDFQMLRGRRIIVRAAHPGERMTTLDGEEREFTSEVLVIADAERAVAIGGVKGGEDSGITDATTEVLLEAAYFTPSQIRATSKALGLATEASYRFERGTDPEIVPLASARAAALIAQLAGGEVLGGLIDVYPLKPAPRKVVMRRAKYEALTGLQIELSEAERILRALGMEPETDVQAEAVRATAPSWRIDIAIEEDLVEEVARISGYEKLKTTLPGSAGAGAYLPGEKERRAVRQTLTSLGFNEAVSFSFVNAEADAAFSNVPAEARLLLNNPIDERQAQMRTTLCAGLLSALAHNFNHGSRNVRLFEMGKCFQQSADDQERPLEIEKLGLVMTGARNEADWRVASERVDFYDLKGAIEAMAESLGFGALTFKAIKNISYLHPGRAAVISAGSSVIGYLGQLHPQVSAGYKFKQPVFLAELNFSEMLLTPQVEVRYSPLPKFPTVTRDLAVLIDEQVEYAAIEQAILALDLSELVSLRLFDLYKGQELPAGKHSMALSLKYRAADRTLTEAEINAAHERIVELLRVKFAAEQR